jgi:MYXO-CTERM domain-containing protein
VVARLDSGLGNSAQRILLSVHGSVTEVVTQIAVPDGSEDYGALIPVPAQPTLDATPVAEADLDALDDATKPTVYLTEDEPGGCTCIPVAGDDGGEALPAIQLSEPVEIGPVTATVLTAETSAALQGWLDDHGFVIPDASLPTVDAYVGSGKYFIALRGNAARSAGPSSIGLHFTLPGDQRALPLRFVSIGAAPRVAFTVFVMANTLIAPSTPFAALTLGDLDAGLLREQRYADAVERAVAEHNGRGFVLERGSEAKYMLQGLPERLRPWIAPDALVTRMSSVLSRESMTADVSFDTAYDGGIYAETYAQLETSGASHPKSGGSLLAVAVAAGLRRRRRPSGVAR